MRVSFACYCFLSAVISAGEAIAHDDSGLMLNADPVHPTQSGAPTIASEDLKLSLVQVELNGRVLPEPIFIAEQDGALFLPTELIGIHKRPIDIDTRVIAGRSFLPASTLPLEILPSGEDKETLRIACDVDCFDSTYVSAKPRIETEMSTVTPGLFLNYDLSLQGGDVGTRAGGLLEVGAFTNTGSGTTNLACTKFDGTAKCTRLSTSWTIDTPSSLQRLVFGDAITSATDWGTPTRYGGIRFGTDFSLTPDLITFPTPSISSEAALPGLVDVIINDAQRYSTEVPAGHFTLTDLPIVTGAGTTQLVITDVLGRETIVSADYYAAPQLLRPGLKEWSFEAGFLREDFGIRSNAYGDGFFAGSYAQGISNDLTLGARSEISDNLQSGGVTGAFLNQELGVIQASASLSHNKSGSGGRIDLHHEWRSAAFSIGSSVAYTTDNYQQFGRTQASPRLTARSFITLSDDDLGNLSVSWTRRDERALEDFSTFGLRFSKTIGSVSLNLSALRLQGAQQSTMATLSLSMPLGKGTSTSIGTEYRDNRLGADLSYRKNSPQAGGIGYYSRASINDHERFEAGTDIRTRYGDGSATLSQVNGRSAGRVSVRGGAALIGDSVTLAPAITDSIAVVTVGDKAGVRVFQDHQLIGTTNQNGHITLTRLRPFEQNVISFDARDVDLASSFRKTAVTITPGLRTGHRVTFESTRQLSVIAYLVDASGDPISRQGQVADIDTGQVYPVGQDGRVFIPDASPMTRLQYVRDRVICQADIHIGKPSMNAPYEDVGEVACLPVARLK